jgi:hypothetical protein
MQLYLAHNGWCAPVLKRLNSLDQNSLWVPFAAISLIPIHFHRERPIGFDVIVSLSAACDMVARSRPGTNCGTVSFHMQTRLPLFTFDASRIRSGKHLSKRGNVWPDIYNTGITHGLWPPHRTHIFSLTVICWCTALHHTSLCFVNISSSLTLRIHRIDISHCRQFSQQIFIFHMSKENRDKYFHRRRNNLKIDGQESFKKCRWWKLLQTSYC